MIRHTVRSAKALAPEHAFETESHAISFDKYEEPVVRASLDFHGYWRKATYEVFPGNYITHYFANQQINLYGFKGFFPQEIAPQYFQGFFQCFVEVHN